LSLAVSLQPPVVLTSRPQRTFLKNPNTQGSVPIYAIGLSLYESVPGMAAEQIGRQVIRTQWLYVARVDPSHA
jgi:hypothetical protein